jgi:hypothetical protein
MGGDPQRSHGRAGIDAFGQAQDALARVIVVPEIGAGDLLDADVPRSGRLEKVVGGLGPRHPGGGENLAVLPVGSLDPGLGVEGQEEGRDEKEKRGIPKEHVTGLRATNTSILPETGREVNSPRRHGEKGRMKILPALVYNES